MHADSERPDIAAVDVTFRAVIEAEVSRIQTLKAGPARELWQATFNRKAPVALTCDLLIRALCWHVQEKAYGGHDRGTLKILASYAKGTSGRPRPRRLKPGTEIVREYQGERHTVVITGEGYRWRDGDYPSLTAIARLITGTNWNGPRFFGLREATHGPRGVGAISGGLETRPLAASPKKGRAPGP